MKTTTLSICTLAATGALLAGCASLDPFAEPDPRWADYTSWTKVLDGNTGDPTGFIGSVHEGSEGYRNVYVNAVGEETLLGDAPYDYPAGTVVVKEQFASREDWEAGNDPAVTVSVKETASDTPVRENWIWADSYTATAGDSAFCSGCHGIAAANDFVFTNGEFIASEME